MTFTNSEHESFSPSNLKLRQDSEFICVAGERRGFVLDKILYWNVRGLPEVSHRIHLDRKIDTLASKTAVTVAETTT